jgi:EAL domain-containing protein (putative c-di-GMP-specific phosphodiesterase class I)
MPLLDEILAGPDLGTAYQPIVSLADHWTPVGYEALARYRSDSPLRNPELLFQYARALTEEVREGAQRPSTA